MSVYKGSIMKETGCECVKPRSKALYLHDEELLLIGKLLVIFVVVETLQEDQKFLLIAAENGFYLRWFLRVRDKHLEHMEGLKLDVFCSYP